MRAKLIVLSAAAAASTVVGVGAIRPAAAAGLPLAWSDDLQLPVVCHNGADFPQSYGSAAVGDLYGDGGREVVMNMPDGTVRVYDSGGHQIWQASIGETSIGSPTLADLDGSGHLSVIASSYSGVYVFDNRGNPRSGWPRTGTYPGGNLQHGFASSVAVGDMYADGRKELFASGLDHQSYGWFADGSPVPGWPHVTGDTAVATPLLVDLENNHHLDVVAPSDSSGGMILPNGITAHAGGIYWTYRPDGSSSSNIGDVNTWTVPWSSPAAGMLDSSGSPIVVNGTGDYFPNQAQGIYGFRGDGSTQPGFPVGTSKPVFASPAVGDLLGDGHREVIAVSEDGRMYGLLGGGQAMAGFPVSLPANAYGTTYAGAAIAPVTSAGRNGIWAASGNQLVGYTVDSGGVNQVYSQAVHPQLGYIINGAPTVADLGHGGLTVIVMSEYGAGCGQTALLRLSAYDIPNTGRSLPEGAWPTFHGNMQRTGSNLGLAPPPPPAAHGYWLVGTDGGVFPFGNARGLGSTGGIHLNQPIVCMAGMPDDSGYWLVASDGGIFPFGGAAFHSYGSTGGTHLNQPIVGMAPTPDGNGYWLVARDGGLFPFGEALRHSYGSTGGIHLNQPIVGMAPTRSGNGYYLVASDGGLFPFGDAAAHSYGSTGGIHLNQPIVGMAVTASGNGYWLVASDGGIFPFGDAASHSYGSTGGMHLNQPIIGMMRTFDGNGYWLVASDGGIFPFGDAHGYGSTGGVHLNSPIVAAAATRLRTPGV